MKTATMAVVTAIAILSLSNPSNAGTNPFVTNPGVNQPVRTAKLRVQVNKTFKEKKPDGTFENRFERVCDTIGEVAVFDSNLSGSPSIVIPKAITCSTALKIGQANVIVAGVVAITRDVDMFGDGKESNFKMFGHSIWVQSGATIKSLPFNYAASDDLNEETMMLNAHGDQFGTDGPNDQVLDESIQVFMKFEDR